MLFGCVNTNSNDRRQDIEIAQPRDTVINGYPSVSAFIASDPDHSTSIYHAFNKLTTRSLLYMEADLFELQKQLEDLDVQDAQQDPNTLECFRSWRRMNDSKDTSQIRRRELIKRIRSAVKEYQEALALQETIFKMAKPQRGTVKALQMWLNGETEGSNGRRAPSFLGLHANRLNDEDDLVALCPERENDLLSRIVEIPYMRLLCLDSSIDESVNFYSKRKINRAVAILSIIIVAILLMGSIVALYLVTDDNVRLGLICVFTAMFAMSISVSTNARRAELFASTAAYAAVLVVFVSGSLGSTSCTLAG